MRQQHSVLTEFHIFCHSRGYALRTTRKYSQRVVAAENWLKAHRNTSLIWAIPRDLQAWLLSTGSSPRNRNSCRAALIAFYDFLIDQEAVEVNPAASLMRIREERHIPRHHPPHVVQAILAAGKILGPQYHALVAFLAYTGARKSEIRCLEWASLDLVDRTVRIRGKGAGGMDSRYGGKVREVPLHPELVEVLGRWRRECASARWVFPSSRNPDRPISDSCFKEWLYEVGSEVGIDHLNPHSFRHSFASKVLEETKDLLVVRDLLGHASVSTTEIYAHILSPRHRQAVEGLSWRQRERESKGAGESRVRESGPPPDLGAIGGIEH